MIYAVIFEDEASRAGERPRLMPQHLAFLERNSEAVLAAGPLKDTSDGAAAGGLWLVEAEGQEAVQALVEADPFWPSGLRRSVRVLEWTRVFAEGVRQI